MADALEPKIGHRWIGAGQANRCVNCGTVIDRIEMPGGRVVKMYFVSGKWTGQRPECIAH